MSESQKPIIKPLLRGHFHQGAFFFSLGACAMLIAKSHELVSIISMLIYSLSLCGLFGISALYHRVQWSTERRAWMRRLDHSSIFVLIAGSATPICLLALSRESASRVLVFIWIATVMGVIQSLFWVNAPKWLSAVLYVSVGWMVAPYLREFHATLGIAKVTLLLLGGLVYTIGALVYAFRYPNPSPRYFGYHEIFHLLVIVGAAFHFVVILGLVN
ncbi:MAG: hemolysin III family protein [Pseudomonadota bacterium]|nr:hemolysin III family protein [Pseudomonadota bacterium]